MAAAEQLQSHKDPTIRRYLLLVLKLAFIKSWNGSFAINRGWNSWRFMRLGLKFASPTSPAGHLIYRFYDSPTKRMTHHTMYTMLKVFRLFLFSDICKFAYNRDIRKFSCFMVIKWPAHLLQPSTTSYFSSLHVNDNTKVEEIPPPQPQQKENSIINSYLQSLSS